MERQLPILTIEGADFVVDVVHQELRELDNPLNTISFLEMKDNGTHYSLNYDPTEKNLPGLFKQSIVVDIPQMVQLDPEGMAAHHGISVEEVKSKTDFDIIVNKHLVALREKVTLPIIDIAGHPFFVDLRLDSLRPKDDFTTTGIQFSDIDHCLLEDERVYQITYNPDTRTYADIDFEKITAIPKDIIVVEIPFQPTLDPVGYARKYGLDAREILRAHPPVADMKAKIVPWSETPINEIIERNLKKQIKPEQKKGRRL